MTKWQQKQSRLARRTTNGFANLKAKGELIEFRDLFIGTIAAAHGFALKTNNKRHFLKIPQLPLL